MRNVLIIIFGWLWGAIPILADGYDPANPQDPYMQYKVTATVSPTAAGTASTSGKFKAGTEITMNTSASSTDYTFKHWTKDGVVYSTQKNFKYTVQTESAEFVAVYEYTPQGSGGGGTVVYDPTNPADPYLNLKDHEETQDVYYTLNLTSNLEGACSFNLTSGISVKQETYVALSCYPNQGFVFKGWYNGSTKVSSSQAFNYMPTANTTLTAMFEKYNPGNPDDPSQSEEYGNESAVQAGDVNGDTDVNTTDAVLVINYYLGKQMSIDKKAADMNNDDDINTTDAVLIINKYLGK